MTATSPSQRPEPRATTEPSTRRPVVLIIDVEPDGRTVLDIENGWKGSDDTIEHVARIRGELEDATRMQVRFNWFLRTDPQIARAWGRADWVAEACPRVIRAIEQNDDYSGVHIHTWRWNESRQKWFSDFKDVAWISECVATAIDGYRSIFGFAPEANRFGDRWISEDAVGVLRKSGIRYDLTVEPGLPGMPIHDDPHSTDWLPDFRGAPREPYTPMGNNYLLTSGAAPGAGKLWMLPLTTTSIRWRFVRRFPYVVRGSRSPNLALSHSYVWPHLRAELDQPADAPLVMVLRTGDLANRGFLRNFLRTTTRLVQHPGLAYSEFTSTPEAIGRWLSRAS